MLIDLAWHSEHMIGFILIVALLVVGPLALVAGVALAAMTLKSGAPSTAQTSSKIATITTCGTMVTRTRHGARWSGTTVGARGGARRSGRREMRRCGPMHAVFPRLGEIGRAHV